MVQRMTAGKARTMRRLYDCPQALPAWLVAARTCLYGASLLQGRADRMQIQDGILDAIGNTPLIKLQRASEATGCTILGKAEFMNPGQSVKDRAALFIIHDAIERGLLQPGGVIVEGTA